MGREGGEPPTFITKFTPMLTSAFIRQIVSAIYFPPFGKVLLSSVC